MRKVLKLNQSVRFSLVTIGTKVRMDIKLFVRDNGRFTESHYSSNGTDNIAISVYPVMSLYIVRPRDVDENGQPVRSPLNQNDILGMTKAQFPIMATELRGIFEDLKTPDLYKYAKDVLVLDESKAEKIRRVFMVGRTTVELSAVVIKADDHAEQPVDMEGIKIKFNNEQSTVMLTIHELTALLWSMEHLDIDSLTLKLYDMYMRNGSVSNASNTISPYGTDTPSPVPVDIIPKILQ